MLEVRVKGLCSRHRHHDGTRWHHHTSSGRRHDQRYRCGWQIKSHNFVHSNLLPTDGAENILLLVVHERNIVVEAVCVDLVTDVTR